MTDVKPYRDSTSGKKEQVAEMFNHIAPKYDFLNHFLSFGIDKLWRRRAIQLVKRHSPRSVLDVATGTGDFAIAALKTGATQITGIDISEEMLAVGRRKMEERGLAKKIKLYQGDSESISFDNNYFDAVTVAFGVRNFENLNQGLREIFRVLKPGGVVCVLEFSKPRRFPVKQFYNFYSSHILPFLGRLFSKDKSAYTYLPESVEAFPDGDDFLEQLRLVGFGNAFEERQTFGIATVYIGIKPLAE